MKNDFNILVKLKQILNTYTNEELKDSELWIDAEKEVETFIIDEFGITLITTGTTIDINKMLLKG